MPRDQRPYITVTVDMDRNPKYAALNDAQKFLLIRAWLHCAEFLTDGYISMAAWRKMGTNRNRNALLDCEACSVDAEQNCIIFHDYLEHQQSRADVTTKREQARSAGKKGGRAKAANSHRNASQTPSETLAAAKRNPSESLADIDIDKEQEIPTHVGNSSLVSNAHASEAETIAAALNKPGPAVPIDAHKLVRSVISDSEPAAVRTELSLQAAAMLHQKPPIPADDIRAGLELWLTKSELGPKALPSLVSGLRRARNTPATPAHLTSAPRMAASDRKKAEQAAVFAELRSQTAATQSPLVQIVDAEPGDWSTAA